MAAARLTAPAHRQARASMTSTTRVLLSLWWGLAAFVVLSTVVFVAIGYSPALYQDQWMEVVTVGKYYAGQADLASFGPMRMSHVVFFPRLFYWADLFLLGGRNLLLIPSILLTQAFACALYVREAWRECPPDHGTALFLVGVYPMLLLSSTQIENLLWGFQMAFVLVYAAATAGIISLAAFLTGARATRRRWLWGGLAIGAAVVATFSMSNGVVVWPLMVCEAALFRARWWEILLLLVIGSLVALWWNTLNTATLSFAYVFLWAPQWSAFLLRELGLPFFVSPTVASVFGAVGLVLGVAVTVHAGWRYRALGRFQYIHLLILWFTLASAGAVALHRVMLPLAVGLGHYYTTTALYYWASLVSLLVVQAQQVRQRPVAHRAVVVGVALAMILFLLPTHLAAGRMARRIHDTREQGALAVIAGVWDLAALEHLSYYPAIVPMLGPVLKAHRLSVFAADWPHFLGQRLVLHYPVALHHTWEGGIEAAELVQEPEGAGLRGRGWRVQGWAWETVRHEAAERVVLVNDADLICGFATTTLACPQPRSARPWSRGVQCGWLGFARAEPGTTLRAFALPAGGDAVQLLGTIQLSLSDGP